MHGRRSRLLLAQNILILFRSFASPKTCDASHESHVTYANDTVADASHWFGFNARLSFSFSLGDAESSFFFFVCLVNCNLPFSSLFSFCLSFEALENLFCLRRHAEWMRFEWTNSYRSNFVFMCASWSIVQLVSFVFTQNEWTIRNQTKQGVPFASNNTHTWLVVQRKFLKIKSSHLTERIDENRKK